MTRYCLLRFAAAALLSLIALHRCSAVEFPGPKPGKARARLDDGRLVLENSAVAVAWRWTGGPLRLAEVANRISGQTLHDDLGEAFAVTLADGRSLPASAFKPVGTPALRRLQPEPDSVRGCRQLAGWQATLPLVSADGTLKLRWQATLRDEANYVNQKLVLTAEAEELSVERVTMLELKAANAKVAGQVDGSPVIAGDFFFACEHPMAENRVEQGRVLCSSRCCEPLRPGKPWSRTSVIGVVPAGQLRRAFLYYLQRQRARPYRLFLHYNSWWDIAWSDRKMHEAQCLEVIELFGRELVEKRGVAIESFCFDDGWDDNRSLWEFHRGFPEGFAPLRRAAARRGSSVGTWLSPWGGYGAAKAERLAFGQSEGFETNPRGFSLAGPNYYAKFSDICKRMIRRYGVNYFKFDGIAQGSNTTGAGKESAADVEALLRLTTELRRIRPDIYLSITTGTWPSPYWLWYGDSVWRNGHDCNFHGAGSMRQRWITYRDMVIRRMIVARAPLYPLNSLMIVAVCYARLGTAAKMSDELGDLADEIRMAFGGGTQLLELYVTPQMMKPEAWDVLAECARWSRRNADVLVDVHWIGGDPGAAEPYGYASWSPRKGILVLRNPSDSTRTLTTDLATAFELPETAARTYSLTSRWARPGRQVAMDLSADQSHCFELEPLEVHVLEAVGQQ